MATDQGVLDSEVDGRWTRVDGTCLRCSEPFGNLEIRGKGRGTHVLEKLFYLFGGCDSWGIIICNISGLLVQGGASPVLFVGFSCSH